MTWIKEARKAKGLTQQQVAQAAGIGQQAYSKIENGKRSLRVPHAKRIAEVLEVDWTRFYETGHDAKAKGILSADYTKLTVLDMSTGKEIAVITNDLITTAAADIVIKLTPSYV